MNSKIETVFKYLTFVVFILGLALLVYVLFPIKADAGGVEVSDKIEDIIGLTASGNTFLFMVRDPVNSNTVSRVVNTNPGLDPEILLDSTNSIWADVKMRRTKKGDFAYKLALHFTSAKDLVSLGLVPEASTNK